MQHMGLEGVHGQLSPFLIRQCVTSRRIKIGTFKAKESDADIGPSVNAGPGAAPPFIASQIGLPEVLKDFDPRPYLCPESRLAF